MQVRNTFAIFIVSGFWHGANWTFIVWGALNAIYFLPLLLLNKNRSNLDIAGKGGLFPKAKEVFGMMGTFGLTVIAWIFFRADSLGHAFSYIQGIFTKSLFMMPTILPKLVLALLAFFLVVEWLGREAEFALNQLMMKERRTVRWSFYLLLVAMIILFSGKQQEFIYFQF
jgi:D-alanyl-lipoteichoic acid acyltransferase DltB (MBOAT superfamily)